MMKGASIYLDKSTKNYWHRDTLHSYIEYEIYDKNGKHIGTADENGNITGTGIIGINAKIKNKK